MIEVWYCWKELVENRGGELRLITPWADPMLYEHRFDFLYKTPAEAIDHKREVAPDEEWVLCKETLEVIPEDEIGDQWSGYSSDSYTG